MRCKKVPKLPFKSDKKEWKMTRYSGHYHIALIAIIVFHLNAAQKISNKKSSRTILSSSNSRRISQEIL